MQDGEEFTPLLFAHKNKVTVNQGEYKAVIEALRQVEARELKNVSLFTDSKLVVQQVKGEWKCKVHKLKSLRGDLRKLLASTESSLEWVGRDFNLAGKILET